MTYAFEGPAPRQREVVFVEEGATPLTGEIDYLLDLVRENDAGRAVLHARTTLEQFKPDDPSHRPLWMDASESVQRLLVLAPNQEAPWLVKGVLLGALGLTIEAGACFAEACRRFRDSLRARAHWGQWLLRQGRPEEAEQAFLSGLRRNPGQGRAVG